MPVIPLIGGNALPRRELLHPLRNTREALEDLPIRKTNTVVIGNCCHNDVITLASNQLSPGAISAMVHTALNVIHGLHRKRGLLDRLVRHHNICVQLRKRPDLGRVLSLSLHTAENGVFFPWVVGQDRIAPRSVEDLRAIFAAFGERPSEEQISEMAKAARKIRGQHQRAGAFLKEELVRAFLDDVHLYGIGNALNDFHSRHNIGYVELLKVSAIGERANVAAERVEVI